MPSDYSPQTLFNPNKTVVKMFVVMYDLRAMPAGHQTFLRQRTFSVPVRRDMNNQNNRKPLGHGRTLRYLVHLRWVRYLSGPHSLHRDICFLMPDISCLPTPIRFQSSKSGKIYLHRDIRLLFSRKSMEVDSGAAYELQSFTESPIDPPYSPRCWGPTRLPPPLPRLQSRINASDRLLLSQQLIQEVLKEKKLKNSSWQDLHGQCPNSDVPSSFVSQNRQREELRDWETSQKWNLVLCWVHGRGSDRSG